MPGTLVMRLWSTGTKPRSSTLTPIASRPRPLPLGRRPTHDSTTSHSNVCGLPSTSAVTSRPFLPFLKPVAFVLRKTSIFFFLSERPISLDSSSSMPGSTRSMNSSTRTSVPSLW